MTKVADLYAEISVKDTLSSALDSADKRMSSFAKNSRVQLTRATEAANEFMRETRGVFLGIGAGVAFGLGYSLKKALDLDSLKRGLVSVAGSAEQAEAQLKRLREVAKLPGLGFEEAIQGSIRLQAAGISASMAERALREFGNALAVVGKGKAELDGVVLALTQIVSKGKVSAEEINQIAERVPQIRKVMQEAFGTADTEAIQRMGLSAEQFLDKVIAKLSELERVSGGPKNALENLKDSIDQAAVAAAQGLVPVLANAVTVLSGTAEAFNSLSPGAKSAIGNVVALGAATVVTNLAINKGKSIIQAYVVSVKAKAAADIAAGAASRSMGTSVALSVGSFIAQNAAIAGGVVVINHYAQKAEEAAQRHAEAMKLLEDTTKKTMATAKREVELAASRGLADLANLAKATRGLGDETSRAIQEMADNALRDFGKFIDIQGKVVDYTAEAANKNAIAWHKQAQAATDQFRRVDVAATGTAQFMKMFGMEVRTQKDNFIQNLEAMAKKAEEAGQRVRASWPKLDEINNDARVAARNAENARRYGGLSQEEELQRKLSAWEKKRADLAERLTQAQMSNNKFQKDQLTKELKAIGKQIRDGEARLAKLKEQDKGLQPQWTGANPPDTTGETADPFQHGPIITETGKLIRNLKELEEHQLAVARSSESYRNALHAVWNETKMLRAQSELQEIATRHFIETGGNLTQVQLDTIAGALKHRDAVRAEREAIITRNRSMVEAVLRIMQMGRAMLFSSRAAQDNFSALNAMQSVIGAVKNAFAAAQPAINAYMRRQETFNKYIQDLNIKLIALTKGEEAAAKAALMMNDALSSGEADVILGLQRKISELEKLRDLARDIADGITDAFIDGLERIREEGFGGFLRAFEKMLFDMALAVLRAQVFQYLNQLIGNLVGAFGGGGGITGQLNSGHGLEWIPGGGIHAIQSGGGGIGTLQAAGGPVVVNMTVVTPNSRSFEQNTNQVMDGVFRESYRQTRRNRGRV